jgi:hypothetical protein
MLMLRISPGGVGCESLYLKPSGTRLLLLTVAVGLDQ